jgi:exportin-2 (importin alpha re-exporter)
MLKSPPSVQKQLSTAIAIIGKEDFPAKWPNLINDMVSTEQVVVIFPSRCILI